MIRAFKFCVLSLALASVSSIETFAGPKQDLESQIQQTSSQLGKAMNQSASVKETRKAFKDALDLYFKIPDAAGISETDKQALLNTLSKSIGETFAQMTSDFSDPEIIKKPAGETPFEWLGRKLKILFARGVEDFASIPRTLPILGSDSRLTSKIADVPIDIVRSLAANLSKRAGHYDKGESQSEIDAANLLLESLKSAEPMKFGWTNAVAWMVWLSAGVYCLFDPPVELVIERTTWSPLIAGALPWVGAFYLLARSRSIHSGLRFYKSMTVFGHELERLQDGKAPFSSFTRFVMRKMPTACLWGLRKLSGKPAIPEVLQTNRDFASAAVGSSRLRRR